MKGINNDENRSEREDHDDEGTTTDNDANMMNDNEVDFSGGFQVVMSEKENTIELTDDLRP